MKRNLTILLFTATLLVGVACEKYSQNQGGGGNEGGGKRLTELNGTSISQDCNLIGIVKDIDGNPIPGVPVTDGYTFVQTDKNGVYQMAASRYARKAYITIPSGYDVPLDEENHLPCFFSPGTIVRANQNRNDFVLTPSAAPEDKITLVMVSDPQCQTAAQVLRYKNETIPDIQNTLSNNADKYPNPYAFTLGDITFDSSNLWESMKSSMSNLKYGSGYLPFFQCIGNHDHTSTTASDFESTALYFENFGPTDYSLNRGNVHIIVMDDIICTSTVTNSSPNRATWNYDGGFTGAQIKWLEQDLDLVDNKEDKMVVLCLHIPFRAGSSSGGGNVNKGAYYSEVLTLLKQFKEAHIMIGHTHFPQNYIHNSYKTKSGKPVYEHIHGAACGGWWACNLNTDGTPNGYYLYEIDAAKGEMINWKAKYTNQTFDYQMRVYNGNQIYTGTKGYLYKWDVATNGGAGAYNVGGSSNIFAKGYAALKNAIVAAVWNDDSQNWKLEYFKDGAKVGDFVRLGDGSCCDICVCSYFFNELGKNTTSWAKSTASHFWYYVPESGDPASEVNWEVRATQTVPSAGTSAENVYSCTSFTTDYTGF